MDEIIYDVSKCTTVVVVENTKPETIFEAIYNEIKQGHYVVVVTYCNRAIFRVDGFNDYAGYDTDVYDGWEGFCKEHHVWDYFNETYWDDEDDCLCEEDAFRDFPELALCD